MSSTPPEHWTRAVSLMGRRKSPSRIGDLNIISHRRGGLLALITACALVTPALAAAPPISATLEPAQIALGDSAELTITTSGTGLDALKLPEVPGLEFRVAGQSRRVEIINGATLSTASVVIRVTPQAAGIYTIPGMTPSSQPLVLRVNPDNGTGSSSSSGNAPSGGLHWPGQLSGGSSAGAKELHLTPDGSAFVRLVLPKRDIYVGESIPVDIELGLHSGFVSSLNGLPTLTGGDFTLNNLSHQPDRTEKLIDGKPFVLLTWHSVIAAVKPGKFSLSAETPITIRVRTRPPRESMLEDLMGDPFLQNFFGATVPKDITVASPPTELTVLSLPTEGRPPDFSGAVGSFTIGSELSSTTAATGDPLTLRMHVSGAGNFDRVDSAMLDHLDQWKTYPPKSSFKASDAVGYKGEKIFEQPLIASRPGVQTLPGLAFSYFDPSAHRYETAHAAPLRVTISPSVADNSRGAPQAPTTASTRDNTAASSSNPASPTSGELRPDHVVTGTSASSLVPLYLRPGFLAIPSVLVLLFAGSWLALRRGVPGSSQNLRKRRTTRATQRMIKQLEAAARAGNAALFFTLARTALAGTSDDNAARIGGQTDDRNSDSDDEEIRQIFKLADEANYAGQALTATDFERWLHIVRHRLLEAKPT